MGKAEKNQGMLVAVIGEMAFVVILIDKRKGHLPQCYRLCLAFLVGHKEPATRGESDKGESCDSNKKGFMVYHAAF